jgi:hypothetical protein
MASAFTARVGIAMAWITSTAESATRKLPTAMIAVFATATPNNAPTAIVEIRATSFWHIVQYHCSPTRSPVDSEVASTIEVTITSWLSAKTPIVGISRATNSSFRELDDELIRDDTEATLPP